MSGEWSCSLVLYWSCSHPLVALESFGEPPSTVSPSPLGPYWEETDERGEIRVAHIDGGGVTVYSTRSAWYSRLAVLKKGGTWEEADDVYLDLSRRAREASAELRPTGALDEFGRPTVRRAPISALPTTALTPLASWPMCRWPCLHVTTRR